jgi:hypothetical protein
MEEVIAALRSFNRFFTQFVGALDPDFLGSGLTLAEARLLFEIAHSDSPRVMSADCSGASPSEAGSSADAATIPGNGPSP